MTLLNIDKRAVREADGLALLVQTSALENPFGISTIYLHPEDCTADGPENQKNTRTKIERLVREFANRVHLKTTLQPVRSSLVHFCHAEDLAEFVLSESREHDFYNAASVPLYDGDNIYMADNIGEKDFKEAACNIILTPRETLTGASFVQGTLKLEDGVLGRIPGLNSAWRFFNLWHEIAHGTGAGEPQANMIAAVITRRAFMDTDILKAVADHGAVDAVLRAEFIMNSKKYGWPMADAVDYVAQQPENIVMGLTEGQIKRLRFQKFDHLAQSVLDVARKIYRTNINAFEDRNLKVMAKVSKEIGAKGELSSQARYINARFGLACERLTGGLSAYSGGFLKRKAVMLSVPESEAYPSLKPEPEFLLPS